MRAHKLDGNGLIVNTIEVDSLNFLPGLVDASIGGGIGDSIINGVVIPKQLVINVPQSVSRFQALAALTNAGLYTAALNAVTAAGGLTKLAWDNAISFERNSPTIASLTTALGLTSAQLDALFIAADKIKA